LTEFGADEPAVALALLLAPPFSIGACRHAPSFAFVLLVSRRILDMSSGSLHSLSLFRTCDTNPCLKIEKLLAERTTGVMVLIFQALSRKRQGKSHLAIFY
jgi:hypothetical protein